MPAARKPVVQQLIDVFRLSERVACKLAGLSRTAFRSKPKTSYRWWPQEAFKGTGNVISTLWLSDAAWLTKGLRLG